MYTSKLCNLISLAATFLLFLCFVEFIFPFLFVFFHYMKYNKKGNENLLFGPHFPLTKMLLPMV